MADHPEYIFELQRRLAELQNQQQALQERQAEVQRQIEAEQEQSEAEREQDEEDEFRFLQKKLTFQFAKFRTEGRRLTNDEIIWAKFRRLRLPKRGRYRGPGLLAGKWKGLRFAWDPDDIGHRDNSAEAKRARIFIQRRLKAHKFDLERTLGWGGNGIASLYRFRRSPDRPVEYVVVKGNIDQRKSKEKRLIREREVQEVGAQPKPQHVVPSS